MDVLRSAKLTDIVGGGKLRRASGPGAGGEPRHCSSYHPRLPDSYFHDYGLSCACRLTAEERRRQADERRALLAALWNSPRGRGGAVAAAEAQFDQVYFTTDDPTVQPVSASW